MADAVAHPASVPGRLAALGAGLPILPEERFAAGPEVSADLPDGLQRLGLGTLPCHAGEYLLQRPITPKARRSRKTGTEIGS